MWTAENRARYNRDRLRHPSDLTDLEWEVIGPIILPAKRGGRKRRVDVREVVNGIMYVLGTGCQWRALPKDFPPRSTVYDHLARWQWDGTLVRMHHEPYVRCRELADREASPIACIIDSQSVKSAEEGGPAPIRRAMMPAKRSTAASATSSLTRGACRWLPSSMRPTFRIAMAGRC